MGGGGGGEKGKGKGDMGERRGRGTWGGGDRTISLTNRETRLSHYCVMFVMLPTAHVEEVSIVDCFKWCGILGCTRK